MIWHINVVALEEGDCSGCSIECERELVDTFLELGYVESVGIGLGVIA
jgi:hypothetical protein